VVSTRHSSRRQLATMGGVTPPKFLIKANFESNAAFFVAMFCLIAFIAWALRDHRRRRLELITEEHEDRVFLALLSGMFVACTSVVYQVFRKQKLKREYEGQGHLVPINKMVDEKVDSIMDTVYKRKIKVEVDNTDEDFRFFMYGLGATTFALLLSWFVTRTAFRPKATQQPPSVYSSTTTGSTITTSFRRKHH